MPEALQKFPAVLSREIEAINSRRRANGRATIVLENENAAARDGIAFPTSGSNLFGLALSGGGIRSAAFCLGVLQALDKAKVLGRIDYLSTVSGGGYIGTALTAATSETADFPFRSEPQLHEPPSLQHIRDFSNYLFPRGLKDFPYNFVIYLRGLAANVLIVLPVLLAMAIYTIYSNRTANHLTSPDIFGHDLRFLIKFQPFGVTQNLLLVFLLVLLVWAVWRSCIRSGRAGEIGSIWAWASMILLYAAAIFAVLELQPVVLRAMFAHAVGEAGGTLATVGAALKTLSKILAPFSAIVGFLSRPLAGVLKRATDQPGSVSFVSKALSAAAIYLAGLSVPFLLWMAYLYLSYWGICPGPDTASPCGLFAPDWMKTVAAFFFGDQDALICLYASVAIITFALSLALSPNANSLHRLYRDRLSKTFLFDPLWRAPARAAADPPAVGVAAAATEQHTAHDLRWRDDFRIRQIDCTRTPYHLLNAALNIEGSKWANRRGRNADFFVFSPLFVGGEATGYASTTDMETKVKELDLATAMAISGAAASSNMGASTIKPLTMTLAILNVRTGFWLLNPMVVSGKQWRIWSWLLAKFYFVNELFGLLRENSEIIYLTDGGHVENLGVYELLRRRCRLIIAVDAEADPAYAFTSFIRLQRLARIDLGVTIDLPWALIRETSQRASAEIAQSGGQLKASGRSRGPHCAIGKISYPGGGTGILLYVKSSITGDESDYIVDYKRRFPAFPQEGTLDQLFSEEQFEVYRALGFHAMDGIVSGTDEICVEQDKAPWSGSPADPLIDEAQSILFPDA